MLVWPFVLIAGLLGAAIASFGQCVITRTIQGRSWVSGRSVCDKCGKQISWYENLPVVSYLLQTGKSRCCKQRLSPIYLISELAVGGACAVVVWWLLSS
jgi:prepilin signal peptidase PulO-like enzyme (type II secretory pathway)